MITYSFVCHQLLSYALHHRTLPGAPWPGRGYKIECHIGIHFKCTSFVSKILILWFNNFNFFLSYAMCCSVSFFLAMLGCALEGVAQWVLHPSTLKGGKFV